MQFLTGIFTNVSYTSHVKPKYMFLPEVVIPSQPLQLKSQCEPLILHLNVILSHFLKSHPKDKGFFPVYKCSVLEGAIKNNNLPFLLHSISMLLQV